MFRALRHHNFRLFWSGAFLSNTGTWMQAVAQGWLEWDRMTYESYYPLVVEGKAGPLLPEAVIAGKGAQSMQAA